jgi:hypothetical protein
VAEEPARCRESALLACPLPWRICQVFAVGSILIDEGNHARIMSDILLNRDRTAINHEIPLQVIEKGARR